MEKQQKRPALSPTEDRARHVLTLAMNLLGVDDDDLARLCDVSRSTIQGKRRGTSRIQLNQIELYAEKLDVPVDLFSMEPIEAGSWLLANRSDQVVSALRCFTGRRPDTSFFQAA